MLRLVIASSVDLQYDLLEEWVLGPGPHLGLGLIDWDNHTKALQAKYGKWKWQFKI